jgi:hypothetical protein
VYILNIFVLVLVRDLNVIASWFQLDADSLTESLIVGRKGELQCVGNVVVPTFISLAPNNDENILQHPFQVTMKISIDTLHILECDLLSQDHLVEGTDEEGVQEAAMEDGQTDNTSDELEVIQMLGVDSRVGVDLKSVVVVRRVFEQAVKGVEHLVRKQEEEFSGKTSVIQTVFTVKLDHQSLLEISSALAHDLMV